MNPTQKIGVLISIQVAIIISSFLILVIFESERTNLANAVNVAGKNRFFAQVVQMEFEEYLENNVSPRNVMETLQDLQENMHLTKEGGQTSNFEASSLPAIYKEDWDKFHEVFLTYELLILDVISQNDFESNSIQEIERVNNLLIQYADNLTNDLSTHQSKLVNQLISLQIIFAIINITSHFILISLILKIFKKVAEEKIRLQKFNTIGELSSKIAHDVRNPLAIIKGAIEMIQIRNKENLSREDTNDLDRIGRAINRISSQVNEVLDFVREKPLKKEYVNLSELINLTISDMDLAPEIKCNIPIKDYEIAGDRIQIQRLFSNLIRNAVQSIGDIGKIDINLKEDDKYIIGEILDSGPEIPEDVQKNIFKPLYTTKNEGTGLGLASCKAIVEKHGGSIRYNNSPKAFIVKFPKII